ncbi:hypothetical protein ACFQL1_01965 [Halomicroarcula sp. GCM10025709]|uniref:hypothetical protein n=1 Tax=Halomicroarcula sp. GCM10025709 TaxID=3252669 RepID=UPI0036142C8D
MPSSTSPAHRWSRLRDERTLTILTGICLAAPLSYLAQTVVALGDGLVLLLLLVGVGVPTAYDEYSPVDGGPARAVGWVAVASCVVTAEFVALVLVCRQFLPLSGWPSRQSPSSGWRC